MRVVWLLAGAILVTALVMAVVGGWLLPALGVEGRLGQALPAAVAGALVGAGVVRLLGTRR